ncbi:hypothetical protein DM02DRAFT_509751, partial [Periconia macrospinosa]
VSWYVFDKYYAATDSVTAYGAALLLAPHRRKSYLDRSWSKKSWVNNVVKSTRNLWLREYKDKGFEQEDPATREGPTEEPDEYDLWNQQHHNQLSTSKDEFDEYITSKAINLNKGMQGLDWWLNPNNRKEFPSLCRMAV